MAYADSSFGGVEVVGAVPFFVFVFLECLWFVSLVIRSEDDEALVVGRGPVNASDCCVVGEGSDSGGFGEEVFYEPDEGCALVVAVGGRLRDLWRMDSRVRITRLCGVLARRVAMDRNLFP